MTDRPIPYAALDPGVRDLVRELEGLGFTPTDSGDGVSKAARGWPCLPFLHVFMVVHPADMVREADRLESLLPVLDRDGLELLVEVSYRPTDGEGVLALIAPRIDAPPPADPALLASANRMLAERLERAERERDALRDAVQAAIDHRCGPAPWHPPDALAAWAALRAALTPSAPTETT